VVAVSVFNWLVLRDTVHLPENQGYILLHDFDWLIGAMRTLTLPSDGDMEKPHGGQTHKIVEFRNG